jgi:predicted RNA-binding protein YlxR (DUF448 family)
MPKQRREPVRTCVACRHEGGKRELARVVRQSDGSAAIDRTGRAPGRGAYVHPSAECIAIARKRRALERALNATIGPEVWAELTPRSSLV